MHVTNMHLAGLVRSALTGPEVCFLDCTYLVSTILLRQSSTNGFNMFHLFGTEVNLLTR